MGAKNFKVISKKGNFPEMMIGIDSVIDVYAAAQFIERGADFIVGPKFDEEIAYLCNKKNIGAIIDFVCWDNKLLKTVGIEGFKVWSNQ